MPRGDRLGWEDDVANGGHGSMTGSVEFYNGVAREGNAEVREAFKTNPSG